MTSCVYAYPLGLCVGVLSDKHSDPQRVDILRERLAFTEPPIKLVSDRRPRVGAGKARVLRWPPVRVPVGTRTCDPCGLAYPLQITTQFFAYPKTRSCAFLRVTV